MLKRFCIPGREEVYEMPDIESVVALLILARISSAESEMLILDPSFGSDLLILDVGCFKDMIRVLPSSEYQPLGMVNMGFL